ncbi:histidine triad nucleotide-binding protein 3-like [Xyrichtys novacula]|uniref:Histidine triad nucleotide-binding protein 3-like n=1 Tax=Xyrichtys novacula TaxID=13765 RepID=A0AAV1GW61_XYRNO|nr:histidine triad nucleotide-binding protein 3-like [Xyrichtys novacula]
MARSDPDQTDETCTFCWIANGQDEETEILKKSKDLVCFRDIVPAAPHHYLVIPRQHITSCHALNSGHISLVKHMAEMGKAVLKDQGFTDTEDIRLGFHQPPYTSIDHLHLHVLAPASQISEYHHYKFIQGTYRFLTDEYLTKCLKKVAPPVRGLESCFSCLSKQREEEVPDFKRREEANLSEKPEAEEATQRGKSGVNKAAASLL